MATHIVNELGSSQCVFPSEIQEGDVLRFNATSTNITGRYLGTMLTYTFPFDCEVSILACGARGGKGNKCTDEQVGKGACVQGDFSFSKGDMLLMCVGQSGTDHGGSSGDGTTGAGGGGTFVVKRTFDGTGDLITDTGTYGGWRVEPLVISAGGNGGRDAGYSGTGTAYHGLATNESMPTYAEYSGGGYRSSHTTTNAGKSFLAGASGASASYSRGGQSYAGFGGGGGNKDDGVGGGGGGYFGGTLNKSASSFIASNATNIERFSGYNFGDGYVIIRFNKLPKAVDIRCKVNGVVKQAESMKVKIANEWNEVVGTRIKINGVWK